MALEYTQKEVELELRDQLKHGDIRRVSLLSGIGESYLEAQFNPNDERKSAAFVFLQIQCALDEISAERGERFWQTIVRFRETSKKRKKSALSVARELAEFHRESADVTGARLCEQSLDSQLREILEAERQLALLKEAVLQEIEAEKASKTENTDKLPVFRDLRAV